MFFWREFLIPKKKQIQSENNRHLNLEGFRWILLTRSDTFPPTHPSPLLIPMAFPPFLLVTLCLPLFPCLFNAGRNLFKSRRQHHQAVINFNQLRLLLLRLTLYEPPPWKGIKLVLWLVMITNRFWLGVFLPLQGRHWRGKVYYYYLNV